MMPSARHLRSGLALSAAALMLALAGCSGAPATGGSGAEPSASAVHASGVASSAEYRELVKKTGVDVS